MARKANPNRIPKESLITRTVTESTYVVTYVPTGTETVAKEEFKTIKNEARAKADIRKAISSKGVIIGIKKESEEKALYGVTIEFFMENATKYTEVK